MKLKRMERGKLLRAGGCLALCLALGFLAVGMAWPAVHSYYGGFCRMEVDCRMEDMTVDNLKQLAEQEKEGTVGLADLAGWRYGPAGQAVDLDTSRKAETGVLYAWGSPSLIVPAKMLDGSGGQAMGIHDCVVTRGLSYALYGAVDTSGSLLAFGGGTYRVTAVIDKEEELLILPTNEGRVEWAAFLLRGRERVKERMEALGVDGKY